MPREQYGNRNIKVLIVDDSPLFLNYIKDTIEKMKGYEVTDTCTYAGIAATICFKKSIDLVLMDVVTDNNASGINAAVSIKKLCPRTKIIIITSFPEYSFIQEAKKAGCESFWYKNSVNDITIQEIIEGTINGESIYPQDTQKVNIFDIPVSSFKPKHLEVLRGVVEGKTYQQIADELGIKKSSIDDRVKKIRDKLGNKYNMKEICSEFVSKGVIRTLNTTNPHNK